MKQRECFINDAELYLFLDRELAAERTAALDSHLKECSDCARRYGVSLELKIRIRGICRDTKAPPKLRDDILIGLATPKFGEELGFWEKIKNVFYGRPLIPVTLALALIIILCSALLLNAPPGKRESLVTAMVREHNEYLEGINADLRIVSSDGKEIERWIETTTGIKIKVPCDTRFSPCGACAVDEDSRKITCLFFGEGAGRISFFIIPGEDSEIESANVHRLKDMLLRCGTCTGNNYIAWSENKLLYILVSRLPEDTLIKLAENLI